MRCRDNWRFRVSPRNICCISWVLGLSLNSFFFFSSRRRHTRSLCDWSSDVCSSDLNASTERAKGIYCYLGAINTFRALGARVIGVPMDSDGMRVDLLESILARHRPRLIYTSPTFQNPTGVVLSPERRRRLLLLARRYQVPILEDDPYSDVYFDEGHQPQPLKAMDMHN